MSSFVDKPKYACALSGALSTLNALPRVVPIIHASPGCGLTQFYATNAGGGYLGSGYIGGAALPSSNICEREIVFGGEERLVQQIEKTVELVDGDLYFVVSGCMVEMIGDDIRSAARSAETGGATVLAAETGGFKGSSFKGYDIVMSTLVRDFVRPSEAREARAVNLLGLVPAQDLFYKGNLNQLKRLLGRLGVKANTFFGEGETLEDLKNSGNAALTVVLSDTYGIAPAKQYEERHHIPYITTGLPIGAEATERFIDEVTEALGVESELTERVKREERERYFGYLTRLSDLYNDGELQRYAIVVADANYAPAFSKYLASDLGFLTELTVIPDLLTDSEMEKVRHRFDTIDSSVAPEIRFEPNQAAIKTHIIRHWEPDRNHAYYNSMTPAVIIGSALETELAASLKLPLLSAAYPAPNRVVLNKGYAGFDGGLSLAEDLLTAIVSWK